MSGHEQYCFSCSLPGTALPRRCSRGFLRILLRCHGFHGRTGVGSPMGHLRRWSTSRGTLSNDPPPPGSDKRRCSRGFLCLSLTNAVATAAALADGLEAGTERARAAASIGAAAAGSPCRQQRLPRGVAQAPAIHSIAPHHIR